MSDDLERDGRGDDEMRALLHRRVGPVDLPPYAELTARATRASSRTRALALAGAIAIALVVLWRAPSLVPAASPSATPACEPAGSAVDGPYRSGEWLWGELETVEVDRGTHQMLWKLRFGVRANAPGPAIVYSRARVLVDGRDLTLASAELFAPTPRVLVADEQVRIDSCRSVTLAIRTSGPLPEGTFTYSVAIDKVLRPGGDTSSESFTTRLTCTNATFTCTPSAVAASATPSAGGSASVVLDRHFGVIYAGRGSGSAPELTPTARREGDSSGGDRLVGNFSNQFIGAISPDGRRAAYFAQPQGAPWGLYLFDPAGPSRQQPLLTLTRENPGGPPVWSSDGRGIAFTVVDESATQGVAPRSAAIRTVELTSTTVRDLAHVSDGSTYELVGWDANTGAIGAVVIPHASAASSYVVIRGTAVRTFPLAGDSRLRASPDSARVAVVSCAAGSGCALRTTTLTDFGTQTEANLGSGLSLALIGFRPGSDEVAVVLTNARSTSVEAWSARSGRRTLAILTDAAPDSVFFRADGGALFVSTGTGDTAVIDLQTGARASLPQPTTGPFPTTRAVASIRFD